MSFFYIVTSTSVGAEPVDSPYPYLTMCAHPNGCAWLFSRAASDVHTVLVRTIPAGYLQRILLSVVCLLHYTPHFVPRVSQRHFSATEQVSKAVDSSIFDMDELNLSVIDEAFGPNSDLYQDVLGVKQSASPSRVERAYFDRRDELFRLLSDMDNSPPREKTASYRFQAEKKMDAVVMAGRILSDPELRLQYDDIRSRRLQGATAKATPERSPTKTPPQPSPTRTDASHRPIQPPTIHAKRNRRTTPRKDNATSVASPRNSSLDTSLNTTIDSEWTDDTTYTDEGTVDTYDESIVTVNRKQGLFSRIKEEVFGVVDDTSQSFNQIFSVFTLRDEDIDAVTRKIHKAERQLAKRM